MKQILPYAGRAVEAASRSARWDSGLFQRLLGAALAHRPRGEFAVSTKVGRLLEPHPAPTGSDLTAGGFAVPDTLVRRPDYSRDGVLRSLNRLRLDRTARPPRWAAAELTEDAGSDLDAAAALQPQVPSV